MAELYLARARGIQGFQKRVALKRILPNYAVQRDFVAMFLDEARLVATLQHPNIAQVYDIGESELGLFFTMEFVHGKDVRHILQSAWERRAYVPIEHVITIGIGAAAGLHAAHQQRGADGEPLRIVHRDVSPANLLVSYDGCVKLIDFGVAKARGRQAESKAGTIKGKLSYMSPEQCTGQEIDHRSDIFSLGISLYELTVSDRLFVGANAFSMMKRIAYRDVPPPSTLRPNYPRALEKIIMRALCRNRDRRYQTAEELQLDLEAFARARGLAVSPVELGRYMRQTFPESPRDWEIDASGAGEPSARNDNTSGSHRLRPRIRRITEELDDPAAYAAAENSLSEIAKEIGDVIVAGMGVDSADLAPGADACVEVHDEPGDHASAEDDAHRDVAEFDSALLDELASNSNVAPLKPASSRRRRWIAGLLIAAAIAIAAAMTASSGPSTVSARAGDATATPNATTEATSDATTEAAPAAHADDLATAGATPSEFRTPRTDATRAPQRSRRVRKSQRGHHTWDPDSALPPSTAVRK